MKKIYLLFLLSSLFCFNKAQAQISVLFVDDSGDAFGNAELFHSALEAVGFPATYYNAVDSASGPTDLYMKDFDLVVWTTSTDDNGLLFWNGLEEDNASIKAYLNGGGKLWVTGLDFLFDRYGEAPDTFAAGDFVYDYLGIASYDVQSYGDDGNLGVPILNPSENSVIAGLTDLTFMFSTVWWVDGVTLVENASAVYEMGDANYIFADRICGSYYDSGVFQTLTYFFDMSLVADFDMLKANVLPVMSHFNDLVSGIEDVVGFDVEATLFPNPSLGQINLQLELEKPADVSVSILDLQGRNVGEIFTKDTLGEGIHTIEYSSTNELPNGYYSLRININGAPFMRPLLLQR
ncbi:MAG: T9SS type A sorting domain-containing protein [Chitinophagales bacterium]